MPLDRRVRDLVGRLTLDEKASRVNSEASGIPRLGIPPYGWWNEALHGVSRTGIATVFPQVIGMAATFDAPLIRRIGAVIATEGRAKYNDAIARGNHETNYGLTYFAPNINIFRDPRWGRGMETYGEDPFLTARLGGEFVRGLQGDHPHYLKAAGCAKHYAVHSGPEALRDNFDVEIDPVTLNEFYLYAFRSLVREAGVAGVMSAYSAVNGKPCSMNPTLLKTILRERWGFKGYVTSDCGAVENIYRTYKIAPDYMRATVLSLSAGVDVSCGHMFRLAEAVRAGLISEAAVDKALYHLFSIQFRLGMFDPPGRVPFSSITLAENDTQTHERLSLETARKSMVLLKNDGILPLSKQFSRVAVIGPNADSLDALLGNYNGIPSSPVTVLQGIRAKLGPRAEVLYARGCDYFTPPLEEEVEGVIRHPQLDPQETAHALELAKNSDLIIFVGGITESSGEGEGRDRQAIELPEIQTKLLQALYATGKPLVYVQMSGSALATPWESKHLRAILQAWYPGEMGGAAVADVLFGDYNPAGRLPVTFYAATGDLPPFNDYAVKNRTYRYFKGKPLYAFGHGLSYTKFAYRDLALTRRSSTSGTVVRLQFKVTNTGARDGDEVVQVYVRNSSLPRLEPSGEDGMAPVDPVHQLCGFSRVSIARGATRTVSLAIPIEHFSRWNPQTQRFEHRPGTYEFEVGASSADIHLSGKVQL